MKQIVHPRLTMRILSALPTVALLIATAAARADVYRWIEAEKPILTNFPGTSPFAPTTDAERATLSGGAWIGATGKRSSPLFAVYDVDVPAGGEFRFYARKFWKHGPYRVRFNDGPWLDVDADVPLLDEQQLRPNVVTNWTSAGTVTLKAGRNRFRIESTTNDGAIGFDCFCITDGFFAARGLAKPGERLTSDEPGWFAWDPPADEAMSPIDLRSLNEKAAGDGGTIVAIDGRFVHEKNGEAVRFWGVNCGSDIIRLDDRDLDQLATLLASRGINLVRLHGPFYITEGSRLGNVDAKQLANIQRAVRIFKRHGIYSTLSIYFPSWITLDESNGWPGYKKQTPFGLLFFDEKFQTLYRGWWRSLLTTPDADGHALKDEPAVLSLELINEDSLFFWSFQPGKTIPTPIAAELEHRFAAWLTKRHGTPAAAITRWQSKITLNGDRPAEDRVGVMDAGAIAGAPKDARSRETARFLFELERDFFASSRAYLRDELGTKSLVSGGNWTTASDQYLTPLERAANLAGDFIDRHAYYDGQHNGPRAAYAVDAGDTFADRSALHFDPQKAGPGAKSTSWNPLVDTSYNDKPTMVSELDWTEPNRFRAEMPILSAALAAQQDIDALAFFAAGGPTWQPTISKFSVLSPVTLAQSPAAALIYRRGLVDEATNVVDGRLNLDELLDLAGGLKGIDGKLRLAGKSRLQIDDGPTSRPSVSGASYIDEAAKTLRNKTRQLSFDYGRGLLVINSPRARALVGAVSKLQDAQAFGSVTIRSSMEFGAIAIVTLDDAASIETSERLLVQVMSEQHNAGWKTSGDVVKKIEALGHAPILLREFGGSVTFNDGSRWIAQLLDQNDQPLGEPMSASETLTLRPDVVHYVLTRATDVPP